MTTVHDKYQNDKKNDLPLPPRQNVQEAFKSLLRRFFQHVLTILFTNDPRKIGQVVLDGRHQFVWLREHVGRKIVLRMFERKESRYFLHYLKEGDICFDIGANVGYYTNLFASRVGRRGRVIAVEPIFRNVLLIQLASAINHTDDIATVLCAAVSDADSPLSVSQRGDSSYANIQSVIKDPGSQVEGVTIDSLIKRFGLPRIDVLKMDIEGWEYKALQGMKGILSDQHVRPRIMMIELYTEHLEKYDSSIEQICEYLEQFGYHPNVLDKRGDLIPFQPEHHNIIYNVFFVDGKKKA